MKLLTEATKHVADLSTRVSKRCLIEGCVFGYEPWDKEPKDECLYCGAPRQYVFPDFNIPIRKLLKKRRPIKISHVNPNCPGADLCEPHGEIRPVRLKTSKSSVRYRRRIGNQENL